MPLSKDNFFNFIMVARKLPFCEIDKLQDLWHIRNCNHKIKTLKGDMIYSPNTYEGEKGDKYNEQIKLYLNDIIELCKKHEIGLNYNKYINGKNAREFDYIEFSINNGRDDITRLFN